MEKELEHVISVRESKDQRLSPPEECRVYIFDVPENKKYVMNKLLDKYLFHSIEETQSMERTRTNEKEPCITATYWTRNDEREYEHYSDKLITIDGIIESY